MSTNAKAVFLAFICLSSLFLSACSSGPPTEGLIAPALKRFGFPPQTQDGGLFARAMIDPNAERALGVDLVSRKGVLPIHLSVEKVSREEKQTIMLTDDSLNARLYLPDGTVLYSLSSDAVAEGLDKRIAGKIAAQAFHASLLKSDGSIKGFLYFGIQPKSKVQLNDGVFTHTDGDVLRNMKASGALMTFNIDINDRPRSFFVGLRP